MRTTEAVRTKKQAPIVATQTEEDEVFTVLTSWNLRFYQILKKMVRQKRYNYPVKIPLKNFIQFVYHVNYTTKASDCK